MAVVEADEWLAFKGNFEAYAQKLMAVVDTTIPWLPPLETPPEPLWCHVSTITAMPYLNGTIDVSQAIIDAYAREHMSEMKVPGARLIDVQPYNPDVVRAKKKRAAPKPVRATSRKTGFCYSTTYCVHTGDKVVKAKLFHKGILHITGSQTDEDIQATTAILQKMLAATTGKAYEVTRLEYAMINCTFDVAWNVRRQTLVDVLQTHYNRAAKFDPLQYQGVLCKLLIDNKLHGSCTCDPPCQLSKKASKRKCTCVTVTVFRTGKFNISGAKNWDHVQFASSWILDVLTRYRSVLECAE
jgi:TATA-box binding protein (TBP) (component of TFIID and TFIIIB)